MRKIINDHDRDDDADVKVVMMMLMMLNAGASMSIIAVVLLLHTDGLAFHYFSSSQLSGLLQCRCGTCAVRSFSKVTCVQVIRVKREAMANSTDPAHAGVGTPENPIPPSLRNTA